MLATEGDPRYDTWSLRSGNIRATVLRTPKITRRKFPFRFATIFSEKNGSAVYRIDTIIQARTELSLDVIDGIRWMPPPVSTYVYPPLANVSHKCRALLDTDDDDAGFTNTLTLHRHRVNRSRHHLVTDTLAQLRTDIDKYRNRTGNYRYAGKRVSLDKGGAKYVLSMKIDNASKVNEAAYTCEFIRKLDRTAVSTLLRVNRPSRKPAIEVLPCESNDRYQSTKSGRLVVYLKKGRETCFRCRASGYPSPEVNVVKDGARLVNSSRMHVDHHVNIVDGRLAETTYTIWEPRAKDDGSYQCEAENSLGKAVVRFKIVVLQ
ncbi:hypothetical protein NP493_2740g00006 [Ridgeia piscesae]|uniref:Ig-like domain-containing protein n=1 Tax=Ridgeia piscesae TaxID=27915 RepID=A0AAD9JDH6_RIDPI|nr:hypothetical protein NP493_2740g00006 [Ridgeia piscesae]